jgi:hypothetical protein
MYEMNKQLAFAGADGLAIMLASGLGQRDGIAVSSELRVGSGVPTYLGIPSCGTQVSWQRVEGIAVSTDGKPVTTAVRVRPMADAHVPGSPPRGAPV